MDTGTQHILNVMHQRPVADVAEEWLSTTSRIEQAARESQVLASREDALQRLALEHFAKRYEYDPGIADTDAEKVHQLLAKSLEAAAGKHGRHHGEALLDCMAGWYLTADRRYRNAVHQAIRYGDHDHE